MPNGTLMHLDGTTLNHGVGGLESLTNTHLDSIRVGESISRIWAIAIND